MELVYLWVEKYKNICQQGFNLSGRCRCHYDGENLTIDENKDYIHIFPKNINVTAIVGKNGSGKSSIINQLLTDEKIHCSVGEEDKIKAKKLWVKNDEGNVERLNCSDLSFNNNIILLHEDIDSELYTNRYNINQYFRKILEIDDSYIVNNIAISFFTNVEQLDYLKNINFVPTHVEFEFIDGFKEADFENLKGHTIDYTDDIHDCPARTTIGQSEIYHLAKFFNIELSTALKKINSEEDIKAYLYLREFVYKATHKDKSSINIIEELILCNFNYKDDFINELHNKLFKHDREEIFQKIISLLNNTPKTLNFKSLEIDLIKNDLEIILSNIHRGFFNVNFFKLSEEGEKIYFSHLSSGEQKFILLFSKIFYVIRKVFFENMQDFIIFLDEPDNYLHPNWQKKLLSYLIDFLSKTKILKDKKISIYLTSHSPFILSDIPKSNILFIDNGMESNGVLHKQTFGANIHTLLSDAFFMDEGLMGEFAKEKIQAVIDFLNGAYDSNLDQEKAWSIIQLIGEPFLKHKLEEKFHEKFSTEEEKRKTKIKQLEDELERLRSAQPEN